MKRIFLFSFFITSFFILKAQHYFLYGLASSGGKNGDGVLFRFDPITSKDTVLLNFSGANGSAPSSYLQLGKNGIIYSTSGTGGSQNMGILFSYTIIPGFENIIFDFTTANGSNPGGGGGGEIFSRGVLYGTTGFGGKYNEGVIFMYDPILNKDSTLFSFKDADGAMTDGGLYAYNDTSFYGMTSEGGSYNYGVIYRFNPLTSKETVLFNFNGSSDGGIPQGTFIKDSNGLLYGVTGQYGVYGDGTLISFNPSTNTESTLVNFNGINGKYSFGDLFLASNNLLYGMAELGGSKNDGVLFSYNVTINILNVVFNFDSINGAYPDGGSIIEDTVNKILYGITYEGGKYNKGVIFSYNIATGKDSVVLDFNGTNGANPYGTLLLIYDSTTGVDDVINNSHCDIFPNPSSGIFTLSLSNVSGKCSVEVYNVMGERVKSEELKAKSEEINISNQPNGVYFYRVIKEDGGLVGEGKLVIEK